MINLVNGVIFQALIEVMLCCIVEAGRGAGFYETCIDSNNSFKCTTSKYGKPYTVQLSNTIFVIENEMQGSNAFPSLIMLLMQTFCLNA